MSIVDSANELGKMISKSDEFKNYNKSQISFINDTNLQREYDKYKEMYNSYMKNKNEDVSNNVDMQYDNLLKNENFVNYVESKEKLDFLMEYVHNLIDFHIDFKKEKSCCATKKSGCTGCGK